MRVRGMILLVEDNEELNVNNSRALKMLGFGVYPALTLAEARDWLQGNNPDIILLDVMLPDGDGIDFCAEIRQPPLSVKAHVLFLTAKTSHADRIRGLASGGDDYITKPFHPQELVARVESAMRRRNMSRVFALGEYMKEHARADKFRAFVSHYDLTDKESETLSLILHKMNTKEMSGSMGISCKGVEFHISNILHKTGIERRRDVPLAYAEWSK